MSSYTIFSFPKESDRPSEKVIKTIGGLYDTKQSLVTTTDTFVKEGNTGMVDKEGKLKQNVVEESTTPHIPENN